MKNPRNQTLEIDHWNSWNQFTRNLKSRIEQAAKKSCLVKIRDSRILEITYTPENNDYSEGFYCVDKNIHLHWSVSGRNFTSTDFDMVEIYETGDPNPNDRKPPINKFEIKWENDNWQILTDGILRASGKNENGETVIGENNGMNEELIYLLIEDVLN